MLIQILSDLHVEAGNPPPAPALEADVLVLAGGFAPYSKQRLCALAKALRGIPIPYVPGNHEFHGHDIDAARAGLGEICAALGIKRLDRRVIVMDGVRFIGATLWTDLHLRDVAQAPGDMALAARGVSDFVGAIRHRGERFTVAESARRHVEDRRFIERRLRRPTRWPLWSPTMRRRHAPSAHGMKGHPLNPAFASDLQRLIACHAPPLWMHGHMRDSVAERLGDTRALANPGGYTPAENPRFEPTPCVRVDA